MMNLDLSLVVNILSVSIALIATLFAIWTWRRAQAAARFLLSYDTLMDINKIVLEHPQFNSQAWCEESLDHADEMRKHQYDIFAQIVWDYLERVYLEYGERALGRAPIYGAMVYFVSLHKKWLVKNQQSFPYYGEQFVAYVDRLPTPL